MTGFVSACNGCMPNAIAWRAILHSGHKARRKRIASRAFAQPPIPEPQQPPLEEFVPDETNVAADFCCAGWFKRQEQLNPLDKVDGETAPPIATPSVRKIQQICALHYGVTVNDITSQRRTKEVIKPRQVAIYLAKEMTNRSFPDIGKRFGDRDHTTVLHAFRKIERLSKTDTKLAADIAAIRELLT